MTFHEIAQDLDQAINAAVPLLNSIAEAEAAQPTAPDKWSRKQILGHLIDSATNNHQRFIRLQYETDLVFPAYAQENWVEAGRYALRPWLDLVDFWSSYNRHLAHVIRHASEGAARNAWKYPSGDMTLAFLMRDYVGHMHHHLRQISPAGLGEVRWQEWNAAPWTL